MLGHPCTKTTMKSHTVCIINSSLKATSLIRHSRRPHERPDYEIIAHKKACCLASVLSRKKISILFLFLCLSMTLGVTVSFDESEDMGMEPDLDRSIQVSLDLGGIGVENPVSICINCSEAKSGR